MNEAPQITKPERLYTFAHWPKALRPPEPVTGSEIRVLLLVGVAAFIAGYDLNIYGLAMPQITRELGIPAEQAGLVVAIFRLGIFPALALCMLADATGRRQLLMTTIIGGAIFTFASGFAQDSTQFVILQTLVRVFMYAEEMLCVVVIAEEFSERTRGWSVGALGALGSLGAGFAALLYAFVSVLPFGWRSLYVIGAIPLFVVAWLRRSLPETRRYTDYASARDGSGSLVVRTLRPAVYLATHYPGRLAALCLTVLPLAFAFAPAIILQSKFLQDYRGFSPGTIAVVYILGGAIATLGHFAAGRLADVLGRKAVLTASILAGVGAFWLMYTQVAIPVITLAWIVGVFAFFSVDTILAALGAELFPTSYRSTASAVRLGMNILTGAVSLGLHGQIMPIAGGFGEAVLTVLPLALAAIPILLVFLPETATRTLEAIAPDKAIHTGDQPE